ncbi:MAG: RMD1 family protein [Alphaproteobacteria bacterium]|nr:RMD1 family protein [Alphaproteobacteria bacterium]
MRAIFLAQRLNLKALEKNQRVAASPFVMNAGMDGYAVLFKYGVVVLFGLDAMEEAAFIENLKLFTIEPLEKPETESVDIMVDASEADGVEPTYIHLKTWSIEHLQTIADIFAKSTVLSYYETRMADIFDRIEPVAQQLQHGGPKEKEARELLKHIGDTLSIQRKMIGQVQVDDKPDILWDKPELERLYLRLEDEYELKERHGALKEKLDMVYRTAETMLGMLSDKRTLRVEWYIVILIIFDIVISMGEKAYEYFFM